MSKFNIGDEVLVIGDGWKKGKTGYVDMIVDQTPTGNKLEDGSDEISPIAYQVYFPEVNRKVYVTEGEMVKNERVSISTEEAIVVNSNQIDKATAAQIGERLNRLVIHVPGGKKGINIVNKKDLQAAIDATTPVDPAPKK